MRSSKKRSGGLIAVIVILTLVLATMAALALTLPEQAPSPTDPGQSATAPTPAPTDPPTIPPTDAPTDPPTEPPTEPPTVLPTEPATRTMRLVTDAMARSGPSLDDEPIADLYMGMIIEVQDTKDGWCSFEYEGKICWLAEELLRESDRYLVVIDAGHQRHGNYDKEPLGPGSEELKAKVSSGTQGIATGLQEYKLNLMVALKLQAELESRGYDVVMTRTEHDVDISNAERATVANELYADAFIRIHANSSEDQSLNGALTICQTEKNPYNSELYAQSQALSELVLDEMCAAAGCRRMYVWETDTMSGINWCMVPVTIVEMGFMSNPEEDRLLSSDDYQDKLTTGIANGIDAYFGR